MKTRLAGHIPLLLFIVARLTGTVQALDVHPLFGDHMVIQRDQPIKVWGTADPGTEISVTLAGISNSVISDSTGHWVTEFESKNAGETVSIEVRSDDRMEIFEDIMIGDVWLASGQSNMGWKINDGVDNKEAVIAEANHPSIRFINIPNQASGKAERVFKHSDWAVCSSESVGDFGAVAYFFAKQIHKDTGVPIGIINNAWGGSSIEAWLSPKALGNLPHKPGPIIREAGQAGFSLIDFNEENEQHIEKMLDLVENSFNALDEGILSLSFKDNAARETSLPGFQDCSRSIIWLQRSFELESISWGSWQLSLGHSPYYVNIFLNGTQILSGKNVSCSSELDPKLLRPGRNQLIVRLAHPWDSPHLTGDTKSACITNSDTGFSINLYDDWRCSESLEPALPSFYSIQQIPHALYNGMLHPLLNAKLKGVIWYQGESNGNNGIQYQDLFPALINQWREQYKQPDLPFLWVQLANFGERQVIDKDGWNYLREAQDMTLKLPHTGMAVAIDVGDPLDIHPTNKAPVGYRLALHALNVAYGRSVVADGPRLKSYKIEGSQVTIQLHNARWLKTRDGNSPSGFAIAGEDRIFHDATARRRGSTLTVYGEEVDQPVAVRYAWAKNPITNLYNELDLPAVPFRTDDWPPEE